MKITKSKIGRTAILSGFLAGMSEVIFISFYSLFSKHSLLVTGSEISKSFFNFSSYNVPTAMLGLIIHFILSLIISSFFIIAMLPFLKQMKNKKNIIIVGLGYLTLIWIFNFIFLLPKINLTFLNIFPYWVTFVSKLLFGLTMTTYLVKSERVDFSDWRY